MAPLHRAEVWPSPLPGVHAVLLHSAHSFARHSHDSHGFGLMDEGAHRSASGRGPVLAAAGDVITVNPGEVHDGVPLARQARRWRMVHVGPDALAALVGRSDLAVVRPVLTDPRVRRDIEALLREWAELRATPGAVSHGRWEEALAQACGALLQRHGNRPDADPVPRAAAMGGSDPALVRVRECLLDQIDAPPDLAQLGALAGVSRFQLVRRFVRAHGLPPFAWLQQQRLRQARALIAAGTPLSEAALACGFADQSHLHRHFVRSFGFTPGLWQRACVRRGPQ